MQKKILVKIVREEQRQSKGKIRRDDKKTAIKIIKDNNLNLICVAYGGISSSDLCGTFSY